MKHIEALHTNGSYKCEQCDYISKNQLSLSHHIREKHSLEPKNKSVWTCPQCNEKFNERYKLTTHCLNKHQLIVEVGNVMNSI